MLPACTLEMMVRILAENSAILPELFHGFPYSLQSNSRKEPLIRPWLLHSITSPKYFSLIILPMDAILYSPSYCQCSYITFDVRSCLVLAFLCIFTKQPTNQPNNQPDQLTDQPMNQPTNQPTNEPTNHQTNQPTNQPINQPVPWEANSFSVS